MPPSRASSRPGLEPRNRNRSEIRNFTRVPRSQFRRTRPVHERGFRATNATSGSWTMTREATTIATVVRPRVRRDFAQPTRRMSSTNRSANHAVMRTGKTAAYARPGALRYAPARVDPTATRATIVTRIATRWASWIPSREIAPLARTTARSMNAKMRNPRTGPARRRETATITAPKVPYVLSPTRFRRTATAVAPRTIWKNTWRERRDATKGATLSWNHRVTAPITATKARNGAWFGRGRDTGTGLRFGRARHPGRRHRLTSVR